MNTNQKITVFPVTQGKRAGRLLELIQDEHRVLGRYEDNREWSQVHSKMINPQCMTIWLELRGAPGDVTLSPVVFYDLMYKVKGIKKTKYA